MSRVWALVLGLTSLSGWGQTLTLTFAGDLMAHRINFQMADFDRIYDDVRAYLAEDDLSFVNLEFPVDDLGDYQTYPLFNVRTPYVEAAIRGGFEVFSLANNHANDRGVTGIVQTLRAMRALSVRHRVFYNGLRPVPGSDFEPVVIDLGKARVGFLAATNLLNAPTGKDKIHFVGYADPWTGHYAEEAAQAFLQAVRTAAQRVDVLVVSLHDGIEYSPLPTPAQVAFYHQLREAGARVVWAHHPHVLQPWRRVGEGVVLYSMGNFISGQIHGLGPSDSRTRRSETGDGALVRLRFSRNGRGEWVLRPPEVVPIAHYRDPRHGWVVRRLPQLLDDPDLPPAWRSYYRHRWEAIRGRFRPLPPLWLWSELKPLSPSSRWLATWP